MNNEPGTENQEPDTAGVMKKAVPWLLMLFSGFAGLVYQVLWMRQLGLLFGNTAHAAAATLSVFFAGLAAGSWFWGLVTAKYSSAGGRSSVRLHPLRLYGLLEVGIALTALPYFGIMPIFCSIYPAVYQTVGPGATLFLVKCVLAMVLVFPPAFLMGGTVPAMGHYLVARKERFGTTVAWIYGINTIGAAAGAAVAAFLFIPRLGFGSTCTSAMMINIAVAIVAFLISRTYSGVRFASSFNEQPASKSMEGVTSAGLGRRTIFIVAFLSGFSVLALEVLWTRMFAQIHENSVYSFAAVLIIVLVCLSLGALLAAFLATARKAPGQTLSVLMIAGGVVLSLSPRLFMEVTGNFAMLPTSGTFRDYVRHLFWVGFATIGPACFLLGTVFPFLMKNEERFADNPGTSIGYLSAVNTVGGVLGSLLCGFVLLRYLGMWWTMYSIAAVYLLAGIVLVTGARVLRITVRLVGAVTLILLLTVFNPSDLRVLGRDPSRGSEKMIRVWETSDSSVAVLQNDSGAVGIKLNSNYVLGSTDAVESQVLQSHIPLFARPQTESIFFLGMGTGITAGGALDRQLFRSVKRVVVCEMVPEVVEAAKLYFAGGEGGEDYTCGLFEDKRVEIVIEDGRQYLMATDESFDMINADLFLPYRSGAGSLYSREHFENVKARLNPGGVFVQWLPLFQLTEQELGTITHTMLSVFDQVTLWRCNFVPGTEIVALVGHKGQAALPSCSLDISAAKRAAVDGGGLDCQLQYPLFCNPQGVTVFYCGNVTRSKELFDQYPVNTDDRPIIEYTAPISMRKKGGEIPVPTFVGPRLTELVDKLLSNCPPDQDPILVNRTHENRRLPLAGAALHRALTALGLQNSETMQRSWDEFIREWTDR